MRTCVILAVVLLASACGTTAYVVPIGLERYAPRPDDWPVEVYLGEDAPVQAHEVLTLAQAKPPECIPAEAMVIGRIDSKSGGFWNSLLATAKEKARELGGDGLVIGPGEISPMGGPRELALTVIRYKP